jgi:hypothetical protein
MKYVPLGTEWLGCVKYYCCHTNQFISNTTSKEKVAASYENVYDKQDMWVNKQLNRTFPEKSYRHLVSDEGLKHKHQPHSFSNVESFFLNGSYGLIYLNRTREKANYLQNIPFGVTGDFIIQNYHEEKRKYEGKSLLIVGGGPSAIDVELANISTDYVWASNNFFLNEKLSNIKLDALAVTPYMDILSNDKLFSFLDNNPQTKIFFETERGDYEKDWQDMQNFIIEKPSQSFLYGTRYRSKIGITPRQICLAIFLGFKDIYVVGFDGVSKAEERHAFENKKELPDWFTRRRTNDGKSDLGRPTKEHQLAIFHESVQFIQFWNYMIKLGNRFNFNLINLGEKYRYNISSEITKWLKSYN